MSYLDDYLQCDPLVIEAARIYGRIETALLATEKAESVPLEKWGEIFPSFNRFTIFTPKFRLDMTRSRYDQKITGTTKKREEQYLNIPLDTRARDQKERNDRREKILFRFLGKRAN